MSAPSRPPRIQRLRYDQHNYWRLPDYHGQPPEPELQLVPVHCWSCRRWAALAAVFAASTGASVQIQQPLITAVLALATVVIIGWEIPGRHDP